MAKQTNTSLGRFVHRVQLTTSKIELASDQENIVLARHSVGEVWASITPVRGSYFLGTFAMMEGRENPSHWIVIRYNRDIDITGYGWLFERRPSGLRWYKIVLVQELNEDGRFWIIQARLEQKSDVAPEPTKKPDYGFQKLPDGVKL